MIKHNQNNSSGKKILIGILSILLVLVFCSSAKALLIYELFNNHNIGAVSNGPTQPTVFSINESYEITEIETYHWNSRRGKAPGQIRLVHNDGTIYGPWQAIGVKGYLDVPNAYWQVHPFVVIKPGTYTIQVSDNASWSHNAESGFRGFAKVYGILSYEQPSTLSSIETKVTGLRFFEAGHDVPSMENRQFSSAFLKSSSRYIFYQLSLEHLAPAERLDFTLTIRYYKPDGSLFGEFNQNSYIDRGWTQSHHYSGFGWPDPGNWETGQYTVKVFENEKELATGSFVIQDRLNSADLLFNWVESEIPDLFYPQGQPTLTFEGIEYRYYAPQNLFLATYEGYFFLIDFNGTVHSLGTVEWWLNAIGLSTPNSLEGTWKRDDGLVIEVRGQNAYFVTFSLDWQTVANAGFVSIGDLKMRNMRQVSQNQWTYEDLWWWRTGGVIDGVYWSDPGKSTITLSDDGNIFTASSQATSPLNGAVNSATSRYTRVR